MLYSIKCCNLFAEAKFNEMEISAKFMVASEQGIHDLFFLKKIQINDMYGSVMEPKELTKYIEQQSDYRSTVKVLNNFNNQLIILYVADRPAGYSLIEKNLSIPKY